MRRASSTDPLRPFSLAHASMAFSNPLMRREQYTTRVLGVNVSRGTCLGKTLANTTHFVYYAGMLTDEQLAERRTGIGGSDAGAALGLNPYRSPVDVYMDKLGLGTPFEGNETTHFGNVLEQVIRDEYTRRTGNRLRVPKKMRRHREYPHMLANVDGLVIGERRGFEAKTSDKYLRTQWGPTGSDEVPPSYLIQVNHYMIVYEYDAWDLAVLIGGNDFRIYHFRADPQLHKMIIEKEAEFWRCVTFRDPPPPRSIEDVDTLYPKNSDLNRYADAKTRKALRDLLEAKAKVKEWEDRCDGLKRQVKEHMRDATALLHPDSDKVLATWKTQTTKRLDQKRLADKAPRTFDKYCYESESRVLRVKKEQPEK